ncbi:MAG: carboxypeptidase regulatory-like domain-containing protein [Thermoanaerobaculaceae bacterium]
MTVRGTVHTEKAGTMLSVRVWALGDALAAKPSLLDAPLATAQATGGSPFAIDVGDAVPPLLVDVLAEGHVGARYLVTLPEEASLPAVWLPAGEEVRVRVTRSGKPEPDARVEGQTSRWGMQDQGYGVWSPALPSQRTDGKGEARWWVPVGGGLTCTALARDGRWGRESSFPPFGGAVEVKLNTRALVVKVVDAREEPVAGIEVAAQWAPLGAVARTGEDGSAWVHASPEADADVVAWGESLAGRTLVRRSAAGQVVVKAEPRRWLELAWSGPPRVMVYPSWVPSAIGRVRVLWASGGRVKVPWLEPGGQVLLWAPGFSQVDQQVASADQPVAVALQAGVRVDGVVQDGEQKPLAGLPVWPYLPRFRHRPGTHLSADFLERATLAWGVSDARGRFSMPPLPAGVLRLRATRPGFPAAMHGPVETVAGTRITVAVTFEAGASLAVKVLDPGGQPLEGAAVRVFARDREERPGAWRPRLIELLRQEPAGTAVSDGEGWAEVGALPVGKAWVLLAHPGYVSRVLEAEVPREGVDLGAQTLEAGAAVAGRVVDEGGRGLAGAEVSVHAGDVSGGAAQSDADGRFEVADLPRQGEATIYADLKGYMTPAPVKVTLPAASEVTIRLRAARSLSGRVVDAETQEPVKDAWVDASLDSGWLNRSTARTDERGEFALEEVEPGEIVVAVRAKGYRHASQSVRVPAEGEVPAVTVAIHRGLELRGRVLDAEGQPAPGVQVAARQAEVDVASAQPRSYGEARSGSDGGFAIDGLGPGKHAVEAAADDGGTARTVAEPGGPDALLRLERPGAVQGRVRAGEGVSVAGIKLRVYGGGGYSRETRTDDAGAFGFERVPAGTLNLMAEGHSVARRSQEVKVASGRTTTVEVVLESTGTVVGTVKGVTPAELEGTEVSHFGGVVRPGPDGVFRVENVREGRTQVRVTLRSDGRARTVPADVVAGETTTVEVDFSEGVRVSGSVRRASGEAAGLLVTVNGSGSRGSDGTDETGAFAVEGVAPGRVELEVRDRTGRLLVARTLEVQRDVALDLRVAAGEVRGRVVAARDRAGVAGAAVRVRGAGGGSGKVWATSTDAAGAFVCSELEPGTYEVEASAEGFAAAAATVAVDEAAAEVELVLEPDQSVELVVRQPDGRPAEGVYLTLLRGGVEVAYRQLACDAQGRATLRGLAPGGYEGMVLGRQYWRGAIEVPGPPVTVLLREAGGVIVAVPLAAGGAAWKVRALEAATGQQLPAWAGRGRGYRPGWLEVPDGTAAVAGAIGAVTIEAVAPDGQTHSKTVQVAPAATVTVRFP